MESGIEAAGTDFFTGPELFALEGMKTMAATNETIKAASNKECNFLMS